VRWNRNPREIRLVFDSRHRDKLFFTTFLPIFEVASCTIASYGYIFADDFALLPFVVRGYDFGDHC